MVNLPSAWHRYTAEVVDAIGTDSFAVKVTEAINSVIPYNQIVIICMPKNRPPSFWCSKVPQKRKEAVVDQYLKGCYLLDPWYHACQGGLETGLYFLEDIAPDDFQSSDFYREYYKAIEVINEAVIAVNLDEKVQIQISMGIMEREICDATQAKLATIAPFICAAAKKHWSDINYYPANFLEKNTIIHDHVSNVLENFGNESLSAREREVALLIIRGYSLKAIADMLGVAMGTTKVHCKNLYKKLEINSQSELFSMFLDEISLNSQVSLQNHIS